HARAPSIHAIRHALDAIDGAIRDEPLPERVQPGTDPALEVWRFDPENGSKLADFAGAPGLTCDEFDGGLSDEPTVIFEVGPETTDAQVKNVLGNSSGELERLRQIQGIDALGWYVSFHQRRFQHGVTIPIEGVVTLAAGALSGLKLPLAQRLKLAFHAICRHELYHFAVDCMAANWELAVGTEVYWKAKHRYRNSDGYIEVEEALANAYMLRGFRHPSRELANSGGASPALRKYCSLQPAGYRDGPHYADSRRNYVNGCRELSARFQHVSATRLKWTVPGAFDALLLYADPIRIDWTRCPIIVQDRFGLRDALGIHALFPFAIAHVDETEGFRKAIAKLGSWFRELWDKRKECLARSTAFNGLDFKRWPKAGPDMYSVRVDSNYRAHLRRDRGSGSWSAVAIGTHKEMGHG
ncbi:MAG: hypothetical protein ACREF3_19080, partial [Acetobacteraceae bacterium]